MWLRNYQPHVIKHFLVMKLSNLTLLIIFLLPFISLSQERIVINTVVSKGHKPFSRGYAPVYDYDKKLAQDSLKRQLKSYKIYTYHFQIEQFRYYKYKSGLLETTNFLNFVKEYDVDTTRLINSEVNESIDILVGISSNNDILLYIDSNNNNEFEENERYLHKTNNIDSIPSITVKYDYYNGIEIKSAKAKIKYELTITDSTKFVNSLKEALYIYIANDQHRTGFFAVDTLNYIIKISNIFAGVNYKLDRSRADIITNELESNVFSDLKLANRLIDTFYLSNKKYVIDKVSLTADTIILLRIGEATRHFGYNPGTYLYDFDKVKSGRNSEYYLIDFWGTWCAPCIKLIPDLVNLSKTYSKNNLSIISVGYESLKDSLKYREFIDRYEMNWQHILEFRDKPNISYLSYKLNVELYPTLFLVDKNGLIIFRASYPEHIVILKEKLHNLLLTKP